MNKLALAKEIVTVYQSHGWTLRRVLASNRAADFSTEVKFWFGEASIIESDFDALWFARASHGQREAWELRLWAEQPYALFEAFDADETEEEREAARLEMEHKMREYLAR
jgi:hypothetical protein